MKSGVFRRIFVLFAAVVLLSGIFGEIFITSAVRDNYIENLRKNLAVQITLISKGLSFKQGNFDGLCRQLKADTGARVTIIAGDGKVLGDSDTDSALMDNHLHRTEVAQSRLYESGMAIRRSDTLKYDFLYVAKRISKGEAQERFIRLAVPLDDVDKAVNLLRMKIVLVVVIALFVTSMFSLWQTAYLRRLLGQITDFSRSLSRGEIDKRLFLKNAGEFNEIADNLTTMSVRLQDMIAQHEEEKNRLNVILKSVPDALLIIDAKGVITLSSSSAAHFFGAVPMTGRRFVEVIRNHELSDLVEEVCKTLSSGAVEFRTAGELLRASAWRIEARRYWMGR